MRGEPAEIEFARVNTQRLYESVVRQIKDMIDRGELKPGDRLPPERRLVLQFGVSRGVLSQAFRVLEQDGIIEVRSGASRVVRNAPVAVVDATDVVRNLEKAAIMDLLEARDVLERRIVELACERATEDEVEHIGDVLRRAEKGSLDVGLDEAFHVAVAEATHNVVFANMLRLNLNLLRTTRDLTLQNPGRSRGMLSEHYAIYEAIGRRDKEAAVQAVVRHLSSIKANLTSTT